MRPRTSGRNTPSHPGRGPLTADLERDEQGQAGHILDLLRDYEAGGLEAAFHALATDGLARAQRRDRAVAE